MNNQDAHLKLQAWLDGELSAAEAAEVQAWVAQDAEARLLAEELRNTSAALAGNETSPRLAESREFYWSKIQREIERQEQPVTAGEPVSVFAWLVRLRRQLIPVTGAAFLAMMLGVLVMHSRAGTPDSGEMELASDDMGAYTFRDQSQRMTVVWFYDRADDSEFTDAPPVASLDM